MHLSKQIISLIIFLAIFLLGGSLLGLFYAQADWEWGTDFQPPFVDPTSWTVALDASDNFLITVRFGDLLSGIQSGSVQVQYTTSKSNPSPPETTSWHDVDSDSITEVSCNGTRTSCTFSATISNGGAKRVHFRAKDRTGGPGGGNRSRWFEYRFAEEWFQTKGGDVHAQGNIALKIPGTLRLPEEPYFSLALDSYPGVVSYQGSAFFGEGRVVSQTPPFGWLAASSFLPEKANYDYFYQKLERPDVDNFKNASDQRYCDEVACPTPAGTTIYYVNGDLSIQYNSDWAVPSNSKIVVLVNGNLNINLPANRKITVDSGGFLAFIVKGNITIGEDVGNNPASANRDDPNIEGVYLANEVANGEFKTESRSPIRDDRFVGKGVFKANSFSLNRDLQEKNLKYAAELFIFDPALVLNAPPELWTRRMTWLEVAP